MNKESFDWKDIPRDVRLAVLRSQRSLTMAESLVKALKLTDGGNEAFLAEQCNRYAYENGKLSVKVQDLERRLKDGCALTDSEKEVIAQAADLLAKAKEGNGNWLLKYNAAKSASALQSILKKWGA